jgi:hypothetical protein
MISQRILYGLPQSKEGSQMSKCDEWRRKIDETEDEIRRLEPRPLDVLGYEGLAKRRRQIERLEHQLEVLKDKYERSLQRGGC